MKLALDHLLKNPIYYGPFRWRGQIHQGIHQPLISKELFDKVQNVLKGNTHPSIRHNGFAFHNLITCGVCGCKVIAERKKNKYTYYHCTLSKGKHENADYIREEKIAAMFKRPIKEVTLKEDFVTWLKDGLRQANGSAIDLHNRRVRALNDSYETTKKRLNNLYDMRLDGKIDDEMFNSKEQELKTNLNEIKGQIDNTEAVNPDLYEDACRTLELANRLYSQYVKSNYEDKAKIARAVAWNYSLIGATLYPTYRKPFSLFAKRASCSNWLPTMDAEHYRGRLSKCKEIHILVKMYRRRGKGTAISLYDPLPPLSQKPKPVYPSASSGLRKNIVAMAITVKEYLVQNPQRTYTTAGTHFGVTRARISQLMTILEKLPDDFIRKMGECQDQSLLKAFSGKRLLRITAIESEKERRAEIEHLLPNA